MKQGTEKRKRCFSAALALAMAVGLLAGCGSKTDEGESGKPNDGSEGNTSTDFVYVASYVPIQGEFTGMLRNPAYANGSLYCTAEERTWVELPADQGYDFDPGDGEVIVFEAEEDAVPVTNNAEPAGDEDARIAIEEEPAGGNNGYWDYTTAIYKIGLDGSSKKIPFTPETAEEREDLGEDYSTNTYLSSVSVSGAGDIYTLEEVYKSWTDAPEGVTWETDPDFYEKYYHYENGYVLKRIDEEGNLLSTADLSGLASDLESGDYFYINDFKVDSQGNIYLNGDSAVYVLDSDGNLKSTIQTGDDSVSGMVCTPDGDVLAMVYNWSGDSTTIRLVKLDPETKELGEGTRVPNMYNMTPGGGDYDFYYTNGINFFGYKLETGEAEKLLNWISCDVNPSYAGSALVLEDGRVVALDSHYDYASSGVRTMAMYAGAYSESVVNELIILTKTPADQVPRKETITLATQYLSYNMRSGIIDFNRSSDKYRIEVLDYSEYNTEDDYEAGLTKLKTEIGSGKMPDLLDLTQMNTTQLVNKGLLEDLYPYLDSDADLSREDILPNILTACEVDGKLYQTLGSFSVQTLMGPASLVGDTPGWTVDEFQAALAKLREREPRATALNQYTTRSEILMECLYLDMDNFVDWTTGQCSFDSEGFIKLLEFANSFPSEFDWENYEWSDEDDEYYRVAHGLQMLAAIYMSGFDAYELRIYNSIMGGKGVFVGIPTSFGVGNVLYMNGNSFAMSSSCSNKEAAWSFLRQFFTEDYQSSNGAWGFPTNKKLLQDQMRSAMEIQYQQDENGNYILDENGARIPWDYGTWGWGEFEVSGAPITQEECDQIMELIESCTKIYNYDESIYEIVEEGVAPYFEGERSAEDVAKQLQSKISLYVGEQR